MKTNNYTEVFNAVRRPATASLPPEIVVHKNVRRRGRTRLSVILLDWNCRESLHTLDWLNRQDVPRDSYELIWIDLYSRVEPFVLEHADVVITCNQQGMYHKHKGYNVGLIEAAGDLICVCDSDAVFPKDWVSSVFRSFWTNGLDKPAIPLVLMHHELRTSIKYPPDLKDAEDLKDAARWGWWPVVPNAGACMTVRRADAIRFGGFDEDETYRGYLCGPYDLGWRLCNAGWPEVWHDESCVLWHFAHPDPVAANGFAPTLERLRENTYPHVDMHAWTAVDAFSSGRFQPLLENPVIWERRMADRRIGTAFEEKYAHMTGPEGLPDDLAERLKREQKADIYRTIFGKGIRRALARLARRFVGENRYVAMRLAFARRFTPHLIPGAPEFIEQCGVYNIVKHLGAYFGVPQATGPVDPNDPNDMSNPAIFKAKSLGKARRIAGRRDPLPFLPRKLGVYRGFDVVLYGTEFYGVPSGGKMPRFWLPGAAGAEIIRGASSDEIARGIDAALAVGVAAQ